MTVLIAGCGDLGTETGLRLVREGRRVIGWRRHPGNLPLDIEGVAADLAGELPAIPGDVDTVIVSVAADVSTPSAYRSAYVDGLSNVLNALERDDVVPHRVLFVSSTAVYGDAKGGLVDESTQPAPESFSGELLLEAEALLAARLSGAGTSVVSLRLGGIYGPGRTRLIDQVRKGSAVIPDQPRHTNRIHRDDAAAAIVHLATIPTTPEAVYIGVDQEPAELGDVLRFLASELGCSEPPRGHVDPPRGGDKRCSSARLQGLGFDFAYPSYREGYRAVLAGIGARHP